MRYITISLILLLLFGFIRTGNATRTPASSGIPYESVIDCAPPDRVPVTDVNGKFITALPGLGKHVYAISTQQDSAQLYFNQGLNFYFGYHLRESLASFKEAARFDSSAAMLYWGQALAMGPYYNVYSYSMKRGIPAALEAMNRHRAGATAKENGLMDAIQKRYSADSTNADRPMLDSAYAGEMRRLEKRFDGDDDIKALYVDAVMLEHKWDFWSIEGIARPWTDELVSLCESMLKRDPHQPAALHYYIHITEASKDPSRALAGADRLKDDMPGISHMVHMSTHMYQRNGFFAKGVRVNEDANTAANIEDSLAPMLRIGKNDIVHIYAVQSFCAMTAGMYQAGMPVYNRVKEKIIKNTPKFDNEPYAQFIYMLPVTAEVRLGKWEEILASPAPDQHWKYATVLDCFAKGMAHVHRQELAAAKADLETLTANLGDSLLNVRVKPFNKPVQCARVAAGILEGAIAFADGSKDGAISILEKTIKAEDSLIYREPQEWMIPARQYQGLYLLKMNKPLAAERVYQKDLEKNPGNGWSLIGLYQCKLAQHQTTAAAALKIKYGKAFEAADSIPTASVF